MSVRRGHSSAQIKPVGLVGSVLVQREDEEGMKSPKENSAVRAGIFKASLSQYGRFGEMGNCVRPL